MAVTIGSYEAILSGAVGGNGSATPLPSFTEVLTRGHWDGLDTNVFPPVGADYEVLYPIPPQGNTNHHVHRMDDGRWKVVKKSKDDWRHEPVTLQFRIRASSLATWFDFLLDNKNKEISLAICGIQPFLRTDVTNVVRIIDYTSPVREKEEIYKMSITFLYDPNYNSITL